MDEVIKIIDESSDKKYFTIIPNYIINHSSDTAQALYLQLKRLSGDSGTAYPTMNFLTKQLQASKPTIRKELKYLLEKGWIIDAGFFEITTKGGVQKIKGYKMGDIWKKNMEHYKNKGGKNTTALIESKGGKNKSGGGEKIAPLRITNNKELIKNNNTIEANASGFDSVGSLLKNRPQPLSTVTSTVRGAKYEWQDLAVRWWIKLGLKGKPTASWFKLFRDDRKIIERACSYASDSNAKDLVKLVYWSFNQFKKYGKITFPAKN